MGKRFIELMMGCSWLNQDYRDRLGRVDTVRKIIYRTVAAVVVVVVVVVVLRGTIVNRTKYCE